MRNRALIAAGIAVVLLCVPAASAGGKASTRVTLDFIQPTPGETLYTGDIFSSRKACKNKRKVLVFRARPGADERIGATRSYEGKAQPGYYWTLAKDGLPAGGDYYSKVQPTDRCKGDTSALYPYPS
jgi:hypothetical protein